MLDPPTSTPAAAPPAAGDEQHARHRSRRRPSTSALLGPLAPAAALTVVGLVSARDLVRSAGPEDAALTGPAWQLLGGGPAPVPWTPDGLAVWQTAGWARLTGALDRWPSLAEAGRELVWVCAVLSGVLLWRVARRAGLGQGATALALLAAAAVPGLSGVHAVSAPATLAVPWLLLAAVLLTGRRHRAGRAVRFVGLAASVPAVLLAPDTLLLLVAGTAGALTVGRLRPDWPPRVRVLLAGLLAPVYVGLVLLLPVWDPQPAAGEPWGGGRTTIALVTAVLLAVGAAVAWQLPRWRPPAAALALTTLAVVAPPGRASALAVCLPLAALLLAAGVQAALATAPARAVRPALAVVGVAGLVTALALAVLVLPRVTGTGTGPDGGAGRTALLAWTTSQLPPGRGLTATGLLAAELGHAGARLGPGSDGRPLQVVPGAQTGDTVIAVFGSGASAVSVLDPARTTPTAEQLTRRRLLGAALASNENTPADAEVARVLRSGDVDPRLLTLLAGLAAQFGAGVAELPPVPGEVGTPVRRALVDSVGGEPLSTDPGLSDRVTEWLTAQLPPYAPDTVERVDGGLLLGFDHLPDPDLAVDRAAQ